ncbi:MAG: molybdopterin-binding protein, partial [Armatimonadota bacterium]|nr:molybdopterin-binding protein [Armatimonadota bacterium]
MRAEIISVGTELLLGQITDTNAPFLARLLASYGVDVRFKQTVGDNLERVRASVALALDRADLVVTSGGLGPTEDDLTV